MFQFFSSTIWIERDQRGRMGWKHPEAKPSQNQNADFGPMLSVWLGLNTKTTWLALDTKTTWLG